MMPTSRGFHFCRAFRDAAADPSVANLHEWRKQGKYLRYQFGVFCDARILARRSVSSQPLMRQRKP